MADAEGVTEGAASRPFAGGFCAGPVAFGSFDRPWQGQSCLTVEMVEKGDLVWCGRHGGTSGVVVSDPGVRFEILLLSRGAVQIWGAGPRYHFWANHLICGENGWSKGGC